MSVRFAVLVLAFVLLCRVGAAQQVQSGPQQPLAQAQPRQPAAQPERQPVQNVPANPNAPFQLTAAQQQRLDEVLVAWERESQKVDTLSCNFFRKEYSEVFGDPNKPKVTTGKLAYRTPDQADYQITSKGDEERWVCTGKSVFAFNYKESELTETPLPLELQGKAIANGPLPFLFGVKADELRARYWLRVITPADKVASGEVYMEAWPKTQADSANFRLAWLILRADDLVPIAVKVVLPNNDQTLHQFADISVNHPWTKIFGGNLRPNTPLAWKYIREDPPPAQVERQARQPSGRAGQQGPQQQQQ